MNGILDIKIQNGRVKLIDSTIKELENKINSIGIVDSIISANGCNYFALFELDNAFANKLGNMILENLNESILKSISDLKVEKDKLSNDR